MRFDKHFLQQALASSTILYDNFPSDATFSIDTRTLKKGDIFVALSGQLVDGHDFLQNALDKGAAGFFIDKKKQKIVDSLDQKTLSTKLVIFVEDTFKSFIKMATAWRNQFDCSVVAITGSVGKTSTKELVANILKYNETSFVSSYGNQNTQLGLSLNMLKMKSNHKVALFELGINKRGEMAKLANMLRPTIGLITNIGHSHMEGLGSLNDIAIEKRDIFKYFTETNIGIINGDQKELTGVGYAHPVVKVGGKTVNQIQARKITVKNDHIDFVLKIYKKKYPITLQQTHTGIVYNLLGATAVAHLLGVSDDVIIKAIEKPLTIAGRFERCAIKDNQGLLINDSYNANPESMKSALLAFEKITTESKKIAVLGDMLELGVNSPFWHRQLGRFLRKVPTLKHVILVGENISWTKKTVPVTVRADCVKNWEDAVSLLESTLTGDDVILVKGSHGMKLGNLVKHFTV